jgi:uncharacterized protein (TIGR02145 family)
MVEVILFLSSGIRELFYPFDILKEMIMVNNKLCILLLILSSIFLTTCKKPSFKTDPITVPGTPTIGTATAGNTQATVAFTTPVSNGGSAITRYTATSSPGGFTSTGSASPVTVTGLTNGTAYTFTVTASNAKGTSLASSASNSVTPSTVPGPPTIGTATAGNAQATITFTAPGSNGGSPITGYTVTSSPGGITATGSASPVTVTGLANGTAYTFTVTATNANGTGPASLASNSVTLSTPSTVPGPPTIGTATAGNAQATVIFTAPTSNGGSAITGYTVTSSPGGIIATGSASPLTVTGLINGTAYTFTVTATNANGTGTASSASNSVTPSTVPGPPSIGTATAGNGQATVTFTVPASNGGSAITGYTVTSSPGGLTGTGLASPITVTGLTNGTPYTFTVAATNANGSGPSSAASNSVTPIPAPTLGPPIIGTATAGNGQATVAFTAPVSNGGSAITGYTVTSSPGSITATGSASPITITGLTNGTAYTFTVTATNANGTGPASSASNSVIPSTVPGAPTIGTATAGNGQATVAFTVPVNNGGSPITGYTATSSPGGLTVTGLASPVTVTGLTNGTPYTFTVTATNVNGTGLPSVVSNSVTPSTVPGPPTIGTATAGNGQATVAFTAPVSNGGSAITRYTVTSSPGSITATGSAIPIIVTGLTNGTPYTFTVTATNANGNSLPSSASNSVTPCSVPTAITYPATNNSTTTATLNGTVNANGCSTLVRFEYGLTTSYESNVYANQSPVSGTVLTNVSVNISGLSSGQTYYFRVVATNDIGTTYGDPLTFKTSFICGTRLLDPRDGKTYLTVQIGNQCWFAENLNVGIRINGSEDQTNNAVIEKYCYDNNESNCNLYGGLYQWDEMMKYSMIEMSQGVCPTGWHIPSDYEWKLLEMTLGMDQTTANAAGWRGTNEGGKLKAAGTTYWNSPNTGATNSSLFTALPSGNRSSTGTFDSLGFFTDFWTSTFIIDTQAWYRYLDADHSQIYRIDGYRKFGTPVRCVKD